MSQPPAYRPYSPSYGSTGSPVNPDTRALPRDGSPSMTISTSIVTCASKDNLIVPSHSYKAWFYVNTHENPPRSSWVHPLGPPPSPSPRPSGYAPPQGPPPPDNRGYSPSPYSPQGPYDQKGYGQGPPVPPRPGHNTYGSSSGYRPTPQGGYGSGYGAPQDESRGWFGGGAPLQQQPVEVIQAPPKKRHGMGMGTAVAAGGAGILGGLLVGDLIEHHDEHEREEGFEAAADDPYLGGPGGFDGGFDGPGQDDFGW